MTAIKMCGLTSSVDIITVNNLMPEYIGFVFYKKSKRYIDLRSAKYLKQYLSPKIKAVGVFMNERPETIAELLNTGVIDAAQLHGNETDEEMIKLKTLTDKMVIQAFRINGKEDAIRAEKSLADIILLDAGAGDGKTFDWSLIRKIRRPYFLAGGLNSENVREAIRILKPFGVDVSSGIETDGRKDKEKMVAFTAAVRKEDKE